MGLNWSAPLDCRRRLTHPFVSTNSGTLVMLPKPFVGEVASQRAVDQRGVGCSAAKASIRTTPIIFGGRIPAQNAVVQRAAVRPPSGSRADNGTTSPVA